MNLTIEECEKNRALIVSLLLSTERKGIDNVIRYLDDNGFFMMRIGTFIVTIRIYMDTDFGQ